jgi:hypothetical protein
MNTDLLNYFLWHLELHFPGNAKYASRTIQTYNIYVAQDDTEFEILLELSYPIVQVVGVKKMVPETASTKITR